MSYPDGYAVAPHWVMRNPAIPPNVKLVYVYLEGRLNQDGICWPSHETVSAELGISSASVKRAVAWMRSNSLVKIQRKSKGHGTFNVYTLAKVLPDALRQPKDHCDLLEPKDQDSGPKDQDTGDQKVTQTYKEQPLEVEPIREEPTITFDDFWNAYDKKTGRKAAEAKWKLALKKPGVTPELLVSAAIEYVQWQRTTGNHPQFTKDPARWLNGEHWNDERRATPTKQDGHIALIRELWDNENGSQPKNPLELEG